MPEYPSLCPMIRGVTAALPCRILQIWAVTQAANATGPAWEKNTMIDQGVLQAILTGLGVTVQQTGPDQIMITGILELDMPQGNEQDGHLLAAVQDAIAVWNPAADVEDTDGAILITCG